MPRKLGSMSSYARCCSDSAVAVLCKKLTQSELDGLLASIAYDTTYLHGELSEVTKVNHHQIQCETEYSRRKGT